MTSSSGSAGPGTARAPASSTTDSNGYIYWNDRGGWSNTTRELYTGLDLDGQGDSDEIGLWYNFTITWGTP